MSTPNTAYFLDFDHTLFHTDKFFHVDVRNAFLRFGMDARDWEQSYAAAWPTGYRLEKHVEEVFRRSGSRLPVEEMKRILRSSFSDLRRYLFPDVLPFLEKTKRSGARLCLLSFGNPDWQRYKVAASGIGGYFGRMFLTAKAGGKAGLVQGRAKGFARVVVVDNSSQELDSIKDLAPQAQTYWMNRVPDELLRPADELSRLQFFEARRSLETTPRHRHIRCRSLDGIT